jgi:hypothetical protein
MLYPKPARLDRRAKISTEGPSEVPNVFYQPTLRKPASRSPTPPRRSEAHRRLPSDGERPRPDFMGDSDMENAEFGFDAFAPRPKAPREDRGSNHSFKPSSSLHRPSSGLGRPQSVSQASQPAPASSSSRPLLTATNKPSSAKAALSRRPAVEKAEVNRLLMGQRLHSEINREGAVTSQSAASASTSTVPSSRGSVLGKLTHPV